MSNTSPPYIGNNFFNRLSLNIALSQVCDEYLWLRKKLQVTERNMLVLEVKIQFIFFSYRPTMSFKIVEVMIYDIICLVFSNCWISGELCYP